MRPRQRIAFEHPCARAPETADSKFRVRVSVGPIEVSSILTVNK